MSNARDQVHAMLVLIKHGGRAARGKDVPKNGSECAHAISMKSWRVKELKSSTVGTGEGALRLEEA
jgi:hypothetical protein